MSTGVFGTIRPANIEASDVEIFFYYKPSRSTDDEDFTSYKSLPVEECLLKTSATTDNGNIIPLYGVYNLRLPLEYFDEKGIYNIYIRPKELNATIVDVSVLAAYPDVKGIILNNKVGDLAGISDLTGYRIEFTDGTTRLITSCNSCEPIIVNIGDSYPKTTRYRLIDSSSSFIFCTVSPSSTVSFKPDSSPYIGKAEDEIKIYNTKFTPKMIEIEMVDHDADTISYMLEGDQVRDRDNGIITTYNDDKEIYQQYDYYTIKNTLGNPLYDVKQKRDIISNDQQYDNIITE